MRTYEKIETLYERATDGAKRLIEGRWRDPMVALLRDIEWEWTEKVDGTNIRVYWDGHTVSYGGRTERASIPAPLVNRLNGIFGTEEAAQMFEQLYGEREVYLYGEGYGHKIQAAGSRYIPDGVDFILFDLLIAGNYQPRDSVEACARAFGISCVPVVGRGTLEEAVAYVKAAPRSLLGELPMEGVVCRPAQELQNRTGQRVIVKVKARDFVSMAGKME